jgi:hypothetical protein
VKIFLDSCILFDAVEDRRLERLLHRCKNLGYELHEIVEICEALDIRYGHGWHDFDIVYRRVLDKCADMRIHPNDFIHISHAHYMDADIFLTTDGPIHGSTRINEMIQVMYPDELRAELAKR